MKTSNIRCAVLVVAAALSLNVAAQKNVLKAFEKFKTLKGVTITSSTNEGEGGAKSWRCNVTEFRMWKGAGVTSKEGALQALQDAFKKDSRGKGVTYFGQMKGLGKDASEEEKMKYKKMTVRYNATDAPVVIGTNTDYDVLVLRGKSKNADYRIVVAMEWRPDEQYGYVGTFYEIEGLNSLVSTNTVSAADDEKGGNALMARMNFYRSNYTGEETTESNALLLNMLEYLSTVATHATEQEKKVAKTMMQVMGTETNSDMQKGIILQCMDVVEKLPTSVPKAEDVVIDNEVVNRIRSYRREYDNETYFVEREAIIKRMKEYLGKQTLDAATFPAVHKELYDWREAIQYFVHRDALSKLRGEMEKKYDDAKK